MATLLIYRRYINSVGSVVLGSMLFITLALSVVAAKMAMADTSARAQHPSAYQTELAEKSLLLDITSDQDRVIAVGERGHILHSTDGQNWQQQQVPSIATLTAITLVGQAAWAVGHDATILYQPTPTGPWQVKMFNPQLERPLMDVFFFTPQHGIAVGAYGTFFRTLDGGQRWQQESHPTLLHPDDQAYLQELRQEDEHFYQEELASILPHLNGISQVGERLYLVGERGLVAFSDDQGRRWQRMEIDYQGSFFAIATTLSGKLLVAGLRGNVFEYQDSSQQWRKIVIPGEDSLNAIVPVDTRYTLLLGNNGKLVCLWGDTPETARLDDKQAMINATPFGDQLIAVTAGGIRHLQLARNINTCSGIMPEA